MTTETLPLPPVNEAIVDEHLRDCADDMEGCEDECPSHLPLGEYDPPMKDWIRLQLPTGIMPVYYTGADDEVVVGDSAMFSHAMFLAHGRVYQSIHDPDKLELVGGSLPF